LFRLKKMIDDPSHFFTLNAVLMFMAFIMFLSYYLFLHIQGYKSGRANARTREDKIFNRDHVATNADIENDLRWKRLVRNQLETVPFAFIVFYIATMTAQDPKTRMALIVVIVVYVFARWIYVICYAWALQPWRTLFWGIGNLCVFVAGIAGVIDCFRNLYGINAGPDNP